MGLIEGDKYRSLDSSSFEKRGVIPGLGVRV